MTGTQQQTDTYSFRIERNFFPHNSPYVTLSRRHSTDDGRTGMAPRAYNSCAKRQLRQRRGSFDNGRWEFIHTLRLVVKDQGYTERYDNSQGELATANFAGPLALVLAANQMQPLLP